MKKIVFLFVLVLFFCSCKSDKISSTEDVLARLSPEDQEQTINPSKDNTIQGEKGTKIFIPANSFVFKDGTFPDGNVTVVLKEFYSVSDFISRSLSSLSDSFLLETGGMVNITAVSGGKELEISKTKSFVVAFPNKDTSKKMEPFYGTASSGNSINWVPVFGGGGEGDYLKGLDSTLIDSSMFVTKVRACGYIYSSNENIITWKLKHKDSTIFTFVENNFPQTDTSIINELCKRGLHPNMNVFLNSTGKVSHIDFDTESYDSFPTPLNVRKVISDFLKFMPPFDMRSMKTYDPENGYYLSLCCRSSINWDEYNRRFRNKYSDYQENTVKNMGAEAVNYYVLSFSRLGWINCDRFLYDETEKTDFIVTIDGTASVFAYLVFDNINSILKGETKGDKVVFKNVPINSKVRIIGISNSDGKPLMASSHTLAGKQPFSLSGFQPFTLKELEKQLSKL